MFCLYESVKAQGRPTGAQKNGELPDIGTVRKQNGVSPTMGLVLGGHKPRIIHHMTEEFKHQEGQELDRAMSSPVPSTLQFVIL